MSERMISLAGGDEVPAYLVEALDKLEQTWPGATFYRARPAIVHTILSAQKKRDKDD